MATFNNLLEQIKSPRCRAVVGVLQSAKSKSINRWKDLVSVTHGSIPKASSSIGCSHHRCCQRSERQCAISVHLRQVLQHTRQEQSGTTHRFAVLVHAWLFILECHRWKYSKSDECDSHDSQHLSILQFLWTNDFAVRQNHQSDDQHVQAVHQERQFSPLGHSKVTRIVLRVHSKEPCWWICLLQTRSGQSNQWEQEIEQRIPGLFPQDQRKAARISQRTTMEFQVWSLRIGSRRRGQVSASDCSSDWNWSICSSSENYIFGKFDTFCKRLDRIVDVLNTIESLSGLQNIRVEGLEPIVVKYRSVVDAIKKKSYDMLDHRKPDVSDSFSTSNWHRFPSI